jgi:hypothetical protein
MEDIPWRPLIGADWNPWEFDDFPERVGNVKSPTDFQLSIIFQRGRVETTNQVL